MRVACISYPMFRDYWGGLQIQILETVAHLRAAGVDIRWVDPTAEYLAEYDLVHVFSADNCKTIQYVKTEGKPIVLSSVLQSRWSIWENVVAKLCTEVTAKLTRWEVTTSYQQRHSTLSAADHIIALGKAEKQMLIKRYDQAAEKISVIPNGISQRFFDASPERFRAEYEIGDRFVFCAGDISEYKNQLAVVRATAAMDVSVVLCGTCVETRNGYLQRCIAEGNGRVHYLGRLEHDDPLLASAFAAASVYVLPSKGEVLPLSILEALAAGTPALVTKLHSLDIAPCPPVFDEVDGSDVRAIARGIEDVLRSPVDPARCKALVESYKWENIVAPIIDIYERQLAGGNLR